MSDFTRALEAFHNALPPVLRAKAVKAEADFAKAISDGDMGELKIAIDERDAVLSHLTPAAKAALDRLNASDGEDGEDDGISAVA
jgi:hypothetical protein